jgi:hypothetical protein
MADVMLLRTSDGDPLHGIVTFVFFSYLEHLFYTWIWLDSQSFMKILVGNTDRFERVHQILIFCKVCQFGGAAYGLSNFAALPPLNEWTIALLAILGLGQLLNFSVYNAIGKKGVYYGYKLGVKIPWCTSFPYNVPFLAHPQYLGAVSSYCAIYLLFLQALPMTYFGIFIFGLISSYVFMSCVEQYC